MCAWLTPSCRSWSVIIGLVIVVAMGLAAWFFAPKGENQVYVPLFPSSNPEESPCPPMLTSTCTS